MNHEKLNVFPTQLALTNLKNKLKGAETGFKLLSDRVESLNNKYQLIVSDLKSSQERIQGLFNNANFSLLQVHRAVGPYYLDIVPETIERNHFSLEMQSKNVSGVYLPEFLPKVSIKTNNYLGLAKGGYEITNCRNKFLSALEACIKLASFRVQFNTLDEALKIANRRKNAIDKIIIPRLANTVAYIRTELDEMDREDKFRIKRMVNKKKKLKMLN